MKDDKKKLIETLIDVMNQSCQASTRCDGKNFYWSDLCLSAYEDACYLLEELGYIKLMKRGKNKGYYKVLKWGYDERR